MSAATSVMIQFRCSFCYQQVYAPPEEAGRSQQCGWCHETIEVPPADDELLVEADATMLEQVEQDQREQEEFEQQANLSDTEIQDLVKQKLSVDPTEINDLAAFTSSRLKRFGGHMVDGLLLAFTGGMGFLLLLALIRSELIPSDVFTGRSVSSSDKMNAYLAFYFFPTCLSLIQWNMIATQGQSIGKKLLGMTIVRHDGTNPGFLQGVVMRNWLRHLLNMVPLFALADALFIFGENKRCLHDILAGTHVIDHR